jgi:hypothetical protein
MNPATFFTDDHAVSMTLRDYFAAKALQALLANSQLDGYVADYVRRAYEYADAMIEARGE